MSVLIRVRLDSVDLAKELLRQLEMRQVFARVTVTVEEPEQPRLGSSIPDSTRPNSRCCQVFVVDLRPYFPEQLVQGIDPTQEFFRVLDARREFRGAIPVGWKTPNDLQDLGFRAEEVNDDGGDRVRVRSRHPTQCSFVEARHLVSEFVMDLPVEGDERRDKLPQLSHGFPFPSGLSVEEISRCMASGVLPTTSPSP
jgi:hypothetical protein